MNDIRADRILYSYTHHKPVIKHVSINIRSKGITALVGDNGSGKTTLGKLLAGILKPDSGQVWIDGLASQNMTLSDVGQRMGYLFQNPRKHIVATSVREQLLLAHELLEKDPKEGEANAQALLHLFQLEDKAQASPYTLSHGEVKRLALASILFSKPDFLILDEPTAGLDHTRMIQLSNYLMKVHQKGIGMVLISHNWAFVKKHADRIVTLEEGKIVHDTQSEN